MRGACKIPSTSCKLITVYPLVYFKYIPCSIRINLTWVHNPPSNETGFQRPQSYGTRKTQTCHPEWLDVGLRCSDLHPKLDPKYSKMIQIYIYSTVPIGTPEYEHEAVTTMDSWKMGCFRNHAFSADLPFRNERVVFQRVFSNNILSANLPDFSVTHPSSPTFYIPPDLRPRRDARGWSRPWSWELFLERRSKRLP